MYKTPLTIFVFAIAIICNGQSSETKYFNNVDLGKEVSKEKAKYSQIIIQNSDGTVTIEVYDLRKNALSNSQTFKGEEPYGIWKFSSGNAYTILDYDFPLIYSKEKCNDSIPQITNDIFQDTDSIGYKAPKIMTGELTIYEYLAKNILYPSQAKDEGIEGVVYIKLTITKEGTIENVEVLRGLHILLDKESVRVIRKLKFSSPPTLNGQTIAINCLTLPIRYRLM
ncbi:MAG: energy transducer TonB [Bacteroidetes bacterium]|nr:energy transducer TonB [Bacteroidota bacterium]MBP9923486.1 energy transducer TonB [Bacteroidia bacterium]